MHFGTHICGLRLLQVAWEELQLVRQVGKVRCCVACDAHITWGFAQLKLRRASHPLLALV